MTINMVDKLNDTEVYERILHVLKDVHPGGVSTRSITAETSLGSLDMDSIRVVDLMLGLEEAFDINIEDGIFTRIKTVGDIQLLVKEKLA